MSAQYLDKFGEGANTLHTISTWSMSQLQTDMVFGIGAFFLYIVVPTALLANELRLAKQSDDTSGAAPILNAMAQAGFSIIVWLIFVTVLAYLLVGVAGYRIDSNPAVGIYHFWSVDWMGTDVLTSLTGGKIHTENHEAGLVQAQSIVFTMSIAKLLEILLLGVLLILTVRVSMFLPLYKMRRTSHYQQTSQIDLSALLTFIMIFAMGIALFTVIINMQNMLLKSVLDFAIHMNPSVNSEIAHTKINVLSGLWNLLANGVKEIEAYAIAH